MTEPRYVGHWIAESEIGDPEKWQTFLRSVDYAFERDGFDPARKVRDHGVEERAASDHPERINSGLKFICFRVDVSQQKEEASP